MTGEAVLIVEDEGIIALHLTELLEKAGYNIIGPEYSGETVVRMIETSPPDLILMDVGLAGTIDGIETARQVRQRLPVPVIFLTAYFSERIRDRMREIAPEGYLTKPVMEAELLETIRKALAGRAGKER
jgi:DNA-binding response OmpR family regulator